MSKIFLHFFLQIFLFFFVPKKRIGFLPILRPMTLGKVRVMGLESGTTTSSLAKRSRIFLFTFSSFCFPIFFQIIRASLFVIFFSCFFLVFFTISSCYLPDRLFPYPLLLTHSFIIVSLYICCVYIYICIYIFIYASRFAAFVFLFLLAVFGTCFIMVSLRFSFVCFHLGFTE
uniref:Uncharacterized protein n=1 Tax=Anopheles braziliensis TaxID=58242 RepID=A0A2M3Z3M0_9DIPT